MPQSKRLGSRQESREIKYWIPHPPIVVEGRQVRNDNTKFLKAVQYNP
jgi:hypothetical protein